MTTELAASLLTAIGILAFALSGALLAVRKDMDIVGMLVLATATALGGGMIRDLLLGDTPPVGLLTTWWIGVAALATVIAFVAHHRLSRLRRAVQVADAVGLGVFCATSAVKALEFGMEPLQAVILGTIGGIAGGVIRDLLAGEIPSVLRKDTKLYAVPAVLGSALVVLLIEVGMAELPAMILAGGALIATRILALWRGWRAPAPQQDRPRS